MLPYTTKMRGCRRIEAELNPLVREMLLQRWSHLVQDVSKLLLCPFEIVSSRVESRFIQPQMSLRKISHHENRRLTSPTLTLRAGSLVLMRIQNDLRSSEKLLLGLKFTSWRARRCLP